LLAPNGVADMVDAAPFEQRGGAVTATVGGSLTTNVAELLAEQPLAKVTVTLYKPATDALKLDTLPGLDPFGVVQT
jgi:hypothetical protein